MYFAAGVDKEKCKGCRLCIFACPEPNAIIFKPEEKKIVINTSRCKNCRLCIETCPFKAVSVVSMV
ncbi:4Fe-4S ferredoxin [bacterium Unc6]|nr:4Fe-4S ferredoxin [bacterium Unc6]